MADSTVEGEPVPGRQAASRVRRGITCVALALLALAVGKELRAPPGERRWHGALFGVVPYDLRRPTLDRLRRSLWSPDDDRILLPRSFGVGWSPNLARIVALCRDVIGTAGATGANSRGTVTRDPT